MLSVVLVDPLSALDRMDQYEKKAEAEKPYYGPAGGPEGEDGEPQANKEGMLGMIARFFGFPMRSGEDVNSDFTNLGAMDSREGLSDGDPTGGSKTAGDLGTHLKGLKDKLPVTGQIHDIQITHLGRRIVVIVPCPCTTVAEH